MKDSVFEAFWAFSLRLYDRPGVADRLIELQDEHGVDVNIVLFCCWCGKEGRVPLEASFFQEADRYLHEWRVEVVDTLREIRRILKGGMVGVPRNLSDPLRKEVKLIELEAERVAQLVLASLAPIASSPGSQYNICAALQAYFRHAGIVLTEDICELIDKFSVESLEPVG